jgi:uncharacterized protein (TIGR02453 family)
MIQKETLQFLKDLGKNNNKIWFETNRKRYDAARENDLQIVQQLINGLSSFDVTLNDLEAKKCMFRINRDVRFSANKDPYKTNMGAWFNQGGKKMMNAGYYFHLEPSKSFVAAGMYMPEAALLAKVRQEIDYNFDAFKKIVEAKKFVNAFGGLSKGDGMLLSRPPKGYDINNPAIEYLKLKSFVARVALSDAEIMDKNFVKNAVAYFKILQPLVQFLNTAYDH